MLRTAGQTKRDNLEKSESFLIYRTLRDMNLSKLVAQDVPLFLSLLADLFPSIPPPPKGEYPQVEEALRKQVRRSPFFRHQGMCFGGSMIGEWRSEPVCGLTCRIFTPHRSLHLKSLNVLCPNPLAPFQKLTN